ncbi:MAG: hypothetical protein N2999_07880 [Proteobacteria bacterium]|nr:hypothetical protein [Pseudomonadota bacterium]
MVKKIAIFVVLSLIFTSVFSGVASARSFGRQTQGEVVFTDALYGAAIGGLIGVAAYAVDNDEFGNKVGAGVIVGTILGLAYGVYETRSFVEIRNNRAYVSVPKPEVEVKGKDIVYKLPLFKAEF